MTNVLQFCVIIPLNLKKKTSSNNGAGGGVSWGSTGTTSQIKNILYHPIIILVFFSLLAISYNVKLKNPYQKCFCIVMNFDNYSCDGCILDPSQKICVISITSHADLNKRPTKLIWDIFYRL